MRNRFIAFALVLVACALNPSTINASEYCDRIFNGFADELDGLADKYDRIKTDTELCSVMRSTGVPLYQSIADRTAPLAGKCPRGAQALEFSRSSLEQEKTRMEEICKKAGM